MKIEKNRVVSIHYTLRDGDGEILDSSAGNSPLPYIHGIGALIPGLEKELLGKEKGDKLNVIVPAAEGYGEYDEERLFQVPLTEFDMEEPIEQGMQIQLDTGEGPVIATIVKLDETHATLDLNHPLAGVPLHFDVEVMEVREASEQELAHGHVHGAGGHHH